MTNPTQRSAALDARMWLALVRLACLSALVVSAMLLVDYTSAAPAYCAGESGCAAVRASPYATLGIGLPVPALGLLAFATLLLLTIPTSKKARTLLWAYSIPIALGSLGFLALQFFVIGHVCAFCVVVDVAGIVACAGTWALRRAETGQGVTREPRPAWRFLLLGALAIAAPIAYPKLKPPSPLPPALRAYYAEGKLNVVEFADFQCPYCRRLHPTLRDLVLARGDAVNFVRLNHPLPFHDEADGAARAYLCAEIAGHGETMAERLFDSESLAAPRLLELAQAEGLDLPHFGECLTASSTTERLERESALFEAVGLRGLPSTYIGDELIVGAQPRDALERAFEHAASGTRRTSIGPLPFAAVSLAFAGLILWWPRRRSNS